MAGKVKRNDEVVQSKTARASMRSTVGGRDGYVSAPDLGRIVPLGEGTHAYVLDPRDGRTLHFKVDSERFIEALCELVDAGHGERMARDLAVLAHRYPAAAWQEASTRLEAALAGGAGEERAA